MQQQLKNTTKLSIENVKPLEVWDCITPKGRLWDHMYTNDFASLLAGCLLQIRSASATTLSKAEIPDYAQDYDALYIMGGGSENRAIITQLQQLPIPLIIAQNPIYCALDAAQQLLTASEKSGMVVDVGQTQIKIVVEGKYFSYPRDLLQLPIEETCPQKNALANFIATSISISTDKAPENIILALPCTIDENLNLGPCSYQQMHNNRELINEIIDSTELNKSTIQIINDAELAGLAASRDKRLTSFKKVLVITLGFGVGAAILENR